MENSRRDYTALRRHSLFRSDRNLISSLESDFIEVVWVWIENWFLENIFPVDQPQS